MPVLNTASPGRETAFDSAQQRHFEKNIFYLDPRDATPRAYALPKLDYICKHIKNVENMLDVGAGNGTFTCYWRDRVPNVVGLEQSRKMIERSPCAENLIAGDAYALPYPDHSFDLVFEANLLHHVAEPQEVIAEMQRVAKNYVVCIEPNRNNPPMFAFSVLEPTEHQGLQFTLAYIKRLMSDAGLREIASRTTGMIPQNRTPHWMLPFLKPFDGHIPLGMYNIVITQK